jgi:hypothetical protein
VGSRIFARHAHHLEPYNNKQSSFTRYFDKQTYIGDEKHRAILWQLADAL